MIGLVFSLSSNIALARKGHGKETEISKLLLPPGIQQMADFVDGNTQNHRFGGAEVIVDVWAFLQVETG